MEWSGGDLDGTLLQLIPDQGACFDLVDDLNSFLPGEAGPSGADDFVQFGFQVD